MPLTGNDIRNALGAVGAIGGQMDSFDALAAGANSALADAPDGLTVHGAAAFLATMAQESAFYRTTTEYSAGRNRYSPYDGRGFEMVTWSSNYAAFGVWCKAKGFISNANQFVNNPKSLSDYKWAWLTGVWFFQHNNLWKYANEGNFLAVSQGVNGGNGTIGTRFVPSGYAVRLRMYNSFLSLGSKLLPHGVNPTPQHVDTGQNLNAWLSIADVKKIQSILKVAADGIAGPITVKALETKAGYASVADGVLPVHGSATVKKIQARINQQLGTKLVVDGVLGSATGAALHTYLAKGGVFNNLASQKTTPTPKPKPKPAPVATLSVDGVAGKSTIKALQKYVGTTQDGIISGQDSNWKRVLPSSNWTTVEWKALGHGTGSTAVKALQKKLKIKSDGSLGLGTAKAIQKWVGVKQDGILGVNSVKALQRKLNSFL